MIRRYHLQLPFWLYCGMCVLVGSAAHNSSYNLLYWVFGAMTAGLLISGIVSGAMMMSLRVTRVCPAHGAMGEPLVVHYAVTNRSRWLPAFNLHIEEVASSEPASRRWMPWLKPEPNRMATDGASARDDAAGSRLEARDESVGVSWEQVMPAAEAWIMHLAPRDTVHGEAVFWPKRRSEVRFDRLRIWTTFPFGIIKKSVTIRQPQHTLIYPHVHQLRPSAATAVLPRGPLGAKASVRPGVGDEYYGVRDYRPGDSMRHIAWKRAAGLDQIVAIQRSASNPQRLRVVLNLTQPSHELRIGADEPISGVELEERAIALAASFLRAAEEVGLEVGLSIVGFADMPTPIRRGPWHEGRLMAALAAIDLNRARRFHRGSVPPDAERAGQIVIHPDRVDPALGSHDAWHLTARQLASLVVEPESVQRAGGNASAAGVSAAPPLAVATARSGRPAPAGSSSRGAAA